FQAQVLQELRSDNALCLAGAIFQYQEGRFAEHAEALNPTAKKYRLFGRLWDRLNEDTFHRSHASPHSELAGTVDAVVPSSFPARAGLLIGAVSWRDVFLY